MEKVKQVEFPYVWLCKSLRTEDKQRGSSFSNVDASLLLLLDPIVFNYSQIFVTCQVLVIQNIKLWCQGIFHVCNCRLYGNVSSLCISSISWARLCVFIQYHQDCWSCGSSPPAIIWLASDISHLPFIDWERKLLISRWATVKQIVTHFLVSFCWCMLSIKASWIFSM